jgi:multidrug efflux pump subunit AcrA (membrane-fusion protein)
LLLFCYIRSWLPTLATKPHIGKGYSGCERRANRNCADCAVPGTIFSRNDVQITAGITGQLLMVAELGTIVQQGDAVARIDKRPLLLQRADVRAPFTGVVIERMHRSGEDVVRGESLAQLTDIRNSWTVGQLVSVAVPRISRKAPK